MKVFRPFWRIHLRRSLKRGYSCEDGASAIEFAFIAPVFILIIAGIVDIGGMLVARSDVSAAVSAGSNFLLVNAERVSSAPEEVARQTAAVTGDWLPAGGVVQVRVNGGLTVQYLNGKISTSGNKSSASQCFCAQGTANSMSLGSPVECGKPCGSAGYAGRYINISAVHGYKPLFSGFGIVSPDETIAISSTVNVQ